MGDKSKIEWTEASWNPLVGCSLVSPGCTNCYAMRFAGTRLDGNPKTPHYAGTTQRSKAGPVWTGKLALAPDHILTAPMRWWRPRMIFVNSMSDLFHEAAPDEWIDRVFAIMALNPHHVFQVLTKRAERMRAYVSGLRGSPSLYDACFWIADHFHPKDYHHAAKTGALALARLRSEKPLANVWLGVSVEDQKRADERIPSLLQTPASLRFISAEPLLGPIDLEPRFGTQMNQVGDLSVDDGGRCTFEDTEPPYITRGLDWVIAGGESGPKARPVHPEWARSLRDQCAANGVPFFFKQWGVWRPVEDWEPQDPRRYRARLNPVVVLARDGTQHETWDAAGRGARLMQLAGKSTAGRQLDRREHNDMPVAS